MITKKDIEQIKRLMAVAKSNYVVSGNETIYITDVVEILETLSVEEQKKEKKNG